MSIFLLAYATPAWAQELPIEMDGLTLGVSTRADIERRYGTTLLCARPRNVTDPVAASLEICVSDAVDAKPQAIFLENRLRTLRVLLPEHANISTVVDSLTRRYGPPRKLETGTGEARGLRYWEFGAGDFLLVLSEVRELATGKMRLRVMITDRSGNWIERLEPQIHLENSKKKGYSGTEYSPRFSFYPNTQIRIRP